MKKFTSLLKQRVLLSIATVLLSSAIIPITYACQSNKDCDPCGAWYCNMSTSYGSDEAACNQGCVAACTQKSRTCNYPNGKSDKSGCGCAF